MGTHEKIDRLLPSDISEAMRTAVKAGRYGSSDEILLDALYAWQERQEFRKLKLERLRFQMAEGMEGQPGDGPEIMARLRVKYANLAKR